MGKRSTFARVERDYYPTPPKAVEPLVPHLPPMFTYWEPCAGDGALMDALPGISIHATDIEPRRFDVERADALSYPIPSVDLIITNPPWTREVLHPMIVRFSDRLPTWLLFDADWIHTRQAVPYLPRLRRIVSVGRVKWIKDSPFTGKDNCAWHLFTQPMHRPAKFFGMRHDR